MGLRALRASRTSRHAENCRRSTFATMSCSGRAGEDEGQRTVQTLKKLTRRLLPTGQRQRDDGAANDGTEEGKKCNKIPHLDKIFE